MSNHFWIKDKKQSKSIKTITLTQKQQQQPNPVNLTQQKETFHYIRDKRQMR